MVLLLHRHFRLSLLYVLQPVRLVRAHAWVCHLVMVPGMMVMVTRCPTGT